MSRVTHLLIHRADIRRSVQAHAGPGRFTDVPTTTYAGVSLRISSLTANELRFAEQLQTKATHSVYLEPTQDIKRGDLIVPSTDSYGSRWAGLTFRVTGRIDPSKDHHVKVLVELTQKGS